MHPVHCHPCELGRGNRAACPFEIYAESAGAACFHLRGAEGALEVDYFPEDRDGQWVGVEVKLGEAERDKAVEPLLRLARRAVREPSSPVVVTGTSLAYTRDDGVRVVPLGLLGP